MEAFLLDNASFNMYNILIMSCVEKLDEILLSSDVTERFFKEYDEESFRNYVLDVIPEIEMCRLTPQDNPWHIYDCLRHILKSVEEMNRLSQSLPYKERRMLSYIMLLHDIGKPECRFREYSVFFSREVDKFKGHNIASERIARQVLPCLGFSSQEQDIMTRLILDHDIFMSLTLNPTDKKNTPLDEAFLKNLRMEYDKISCGKDMIGYLVMIGIADNKAQNALLTTQSLRLIMTMGEMNDRLE